MKKSLITVILLAIVLVVAVAAYKGLDLKESLGDTIKIGVIESLSGNAAYYGELNKRGVEIAKEQLKEEHPDVNFEIYHEDSLYTPKGGVDAYTKLKNTNQIDAVITHASPVALAVQPLANNDKVVQMAVSSSASKYSSPNDLSFRTSPKTEIEVQTTKDYINKKGLKKIALIYMNNDVGLSAVDSLEKSLLGSQTSITMKEGFSIDTSDFRTLISKVKNNQSDGVYIVGLASHLVNFLKQKNENNLNIGIMGFRSSEDPVLIKNGAKDAEGFVYTYGFDNTSDNPQSKKFVEKYKEKYSEEPDGYAAEGYEGMMLLGKAYLECGKNSECVKSYLLGLKDYPSVFGPLSFDENGDVSYDFFLKTIKDGKFIKLNE